MTLTSIYKWGAIAGVLLALAGCGGGGSGSGTDSGSTQDGGSGTGQDIASGIVTYENTPVDFTLPPIETGLVYEIVEGPAHGTLTGVAPDLTYSPESDYYGSDAFKYAVVDIAAEEPSTAEIVTVEITVKLSGIASVLPRYAHTGGGTKLLISGSRFTGASVSLDGAAITPDRRDDTFIELTLPPKPAGVYELNVGGEPRELEYRDPLTAKSITTMEHSTCAALTDGRVACWGMVAPFDDDYLYYAEPVFVDAVYAAQKASGTCALLTDGTIHCWRYNYGDARKFHTISDIVGAVDVDARTPNLNCAVINDGTVRCWNASSWDDVPSYPVDGITAAKAISMEHGSACVVQADADVMCWQFGGSAAYGAVAFTVPGSNGASKVARAGDGVCAIMADGTVSCWKIDFYEGIVGTPVKVAGLDSVVDLSGRNNTMCAVLADGAVRCWGDNSKGLLGNDSQEDSAVPVAVKGIESAVEISVSANHVCARLEDGVVRCWGYGAYGQAGVPGSYYGLAVADTDDTITEHPYWNNVDGRCLVVDGGRVSCDYVYDGIENPEFVDGISTAVKTAASNGMRNCALLSDGYVQCWYPGEMPIVIADLSSAVDLTSGTFHFCALIDDGLVKCWGEAANSGVLGNGTLTDSMDTAVTVWGIDSAVDVNAGGLNTCALLTDGSVQCWGDNHVGQLGNTSIPTDTADAYSPIPVTVEGVDDAVQTVAGNTSCALISDGTIRCWGSLFGGMAGIGVPVGASGMVLQPVRVKGITAATRIEAWYGLYVRSGDATPLVAGGHPRRIHRAPLSPMPAPLSPADLQ